MPINGETKVKITRPPLSSRVIQGQGETLRSRINAPFYHNLQAHKASVAVAESTEKKEIQSELIRSNEKLTGAKPNTISNSQIIEEHAYPVGSRGTRDKTPSVKQANTSYPARALVSHDNALSQLNYANHFEKQARSR